MGEGSAGARLERLEVLTARLKADEPVTVARLARETGLSTRTLFRDLALLRARGLPVEADRGRGGGVRLNRRWGIGRLNLTYGQALGLLVHLAIAARLGGPWLLADMDPVRRKLAASFAPEMRARISALQARILIGEAASDPVRSSFAPPEGATMEALFEAFLETRAFRFTYRDGAGLTSQREVEPHILLFNAPVWYLVAWDPLREDARTFRCDRMSRGRAGRGPAFRLREARFFETALAGFAGEA